jgi:hypothetical protein
MLDLIDREYSERGLECMFFDNGDGTGWKVYEDKQIAARSLATQMRCFAEGIGPDCVDELVEVESPFCAEPAYAYLTECVDIANHVFYKFLHPDAGFVTFWTADLELTEEVRDLIYSDQERLLKQVQKVFGTDPDVEHDLHLYNWGYNSNHGPVVIDTGSHFTRCIEKEML